MEPPVSAAGSAIRYVVVTPVRDEERYIPHTIDSMRAQTLQPLAWVIVDDGSTDSTPRIIVQCTQGAPWITVLSTGSAERKLGSAEVLAFDRGLAAVAPNLGFDYVVKLDGDVRLPPDYFERLLARMVEDARWGIASGVYCEESEGGWRPVAMPTYHAAGASKVVRRECFEAIGGFVARKGWDTVDEIRAGLKGWRTGHFSDIQFQHLKPEGVAMGTLRTHRFHGEIYYQTGGGFLFLLAKVAHRMVAARPYVIGGAAMLFGYLHSLAMKEPRLVNVDEARFYRGMLNARLWWSIAHRLPLTRPES